MTNSKEYSREICKRPSHSGTVWRLPSNEIGSDRLHFTGRHPFPLSYAHILNIAFCISHIPQNTTLPTYCIRHQLLRQHPDRRLGCESCLVFVTSSTKIDKHCLQTLDDNNQRCLLCQGVKGDKICQQLSSHNCRGKNQTRNSKRFLFKLYDFMVDNAGYLVCLYVFIFIFCDSSPE